MTLLFWVMSYFFALGPLIIQFFLNLSWTFNQLPNLSRSLLQLSLNSLRLESKPSNMDFRSVSQIEKNFLSIMLGILFQPQHFKNALICHWLSELKCSIGGSVNLKSLQQQSDAFTWNIKSDLRTSREEKERLILRTLTTTYCSIGCDLCCNKCMNQRHRWSILMKQCSRSVHSNQRDGLTTENE